MFSEFDLTFGTPSFGILNLAPDDSGTGDTGSTTPPVSDDDDVPKYSERELQEKIKQSMIKWRKGLQKQASKSEELEKRAADAEAREKDKDSRIEELERQIQKFREGVNPEAAAEMEIQVKKFQRELAEKDKKVEEAEKRVQAAELKAKEVRRDYLLNEALAAASCIDMEGGRRYFLKEIKWDKETEDWGMETEEGNPCSVMTGVKDKLPDYLRPAAMQRGGSGLVTGHPKRVAMEKDLEREEAKLRELKSKAERSGKDGDLFAYRKHKKFVEQKKLELQKSGK